MGETTIENSKILITGGAGFIGSNLADALINDNEIVVVDDLSMGKRKTCLRVPICILLSTLSPITSSCLPC